MNGSKANEIEEKIILGKSGMLVLIVSILVFLASIGIMIFAGIGLEAGRIIRGTVWMVIGCILFLLSCLAWSGLKIVRPNEAMVLTLFGNYYGTLKTDGFYFVNPFVTSINPAAHGMADSMEPTASGMPEQHKRKATALPSKTISLKAITLNNGKQKINDELGNPIEIGIVVIWRVVNTAKAVFSVENYMTFLSMQADSALRNIVRLYPYDVSGSEDECTLRGSSQEVAAKLKQEIQEKVEMAGIEIVEARITHLAYAQEIAAVMLQRQQASAIIDARTMIVEGAVGMVRMALEKLSEENVVELDNERKAAMVSNLLVVLCGNRDAQPIINSGSIY